MTLTKVFLVLCAALLLSMFLLTWLLAELGAYEAFLQLIGDIAAAIRGTGPR